MNKNLIRILLAFFILGPQHAATAKDHQIRFLTSIDAIKDHRTGEIIFYSLNRHQGQQGEVQLLLNPEQKKILKNLSPNDQVIIEGEIIQTMSLEGGGSIKLKAAQVIPISLNRIGVPFNLEATQTMMVHSESIPYGTLKFTASTEVITTIILTSTFLMFNTMMTQSNSPKSINSLNNMLFTGAAALALGAFLYETN